MTAPDVRAAAEQIHDALDATGDGVGYHDRRGGIIDMHSDELAAALLAAGWRPPVRPEHACKPEGDPAHLPSGTRWTCPEDGSVWFSAKRMVGRTMYGEWRPARRRP